jgi:hypothetical protein
LHGSHFFLHAENENVFARGHFHNCEGELPGDDAQAESVWMVLTRRLEGKRQLTSQGC